MTSPAPTRRPYHGSCHCGQTKYIAYLTLPPPTVAVDPHPGTTIRIYKCNCSTCHKAGYFHIRLKDTPNDFVLLSPTDPENGGLGDYQCFEKFAHWYFCKNCGVRCFIVGGKTETVDIDLEKWLGRESEGKTTKVWRPKSDGWVEDGGSYFSLNATSLEPKQDGFDLRGWAEKGWIYYLDMLGGKGEDRFGEPHEGGMY